ncbi:hypothetical protein [Amycolatopsis sp. H20-H5]|nr:hypothetical protein [Amycolatopsis sp. H20-H5]MEC3975355.1 hypothetical protein [Amycolatopsis sp. H20-H5]
MTVSSARDAADTPSGAYPEQGFGPEYTERALDDVGNGVVDVEDRTE